MRRVALALLLPIVVVAAELTVLLTVAHLIGLGWALLILLATSLIGGLLVRRVGSRTWQRFRSALTEGRAPGQEATNGLIALCGGLLIAFPGYVTDVAGALLLIPPIRAVTGVLAQRIITRRLSPEVAGQVFGPRKVRVHQSPPGTRTGPDTPLEGEIIEPGQPTTPRR